MKKYYKCNKVRYVAKDYRLGQKMKNQSVQKEANNEKDDNQKNFVQGSE